MARRGAGQTALTSVLPLRLFTATQSLEPASDGELLEAAFAASSDGMALLDANGKLLQINPAGQAMLPAALSGRRLVDAIVPEARLAFETALARSQGGKAVDVECRAGDKGPWLELTLIGFSLSGASYVLVTVRNVEMDRRLRERARLAERQEALAHLAGGLAHDFNNILTVIIGNAELLNEKLASDQESRALAEVSLSAARAGAELTRLLLASARPHPQQAAEFCAADLVHDLRGLLERSLGPGIVLTIEADSEPWSIRADRAQLASVLLNLALNARHAMPAGGALGIMMRNIAGEMDEADRIEIAVSDTGSGISPAILDRVLEPFFTTKADGTGLGLPMAQDFAHRSNGELAIESKPGAGTTVFLRLPRAQLQLDLPYLASSMVDLRARPDECVLVVERHPAIRKLIAEHLDELGYKTVESPEIVDACRHLERTDRVDLLLCEQSQWGEHGTTIGRNLRSLSPTVPVLLLEGSAGSALTSRSAKPSAPLLAKPFTREELARRVRTTIDGKL